MRVKTSIATALSIAAMLASAPASAAGGIAQIRWPDGNPESDSVQIDGYSWGIRHTGSKPAFRDFRFTKPVTFGSARYAFDAAKGIHLDSAEVTVPLGEGLSLAYCMSGVRIVEITQTQADDEPPHEEVALRYDKLDIQLSLAPNGFTVASLNVKTAQFQFLGTNRCPTRV